MRCARYMRRLQGLLSTYGRNNSAMGFCGCNNRCMVARVYGMWMKWKRNTHTRARMRKKNNLWLSDGPSQQRRREQWARTMSMWHSSAYSTKKANNNTFVFRLSSLVPKSGRADAFNKYVLCNSGFELEQPTSYTLILCKLVPVENFSMDFRFENYGIVWHVERGGKRGLDEKMAKIWWISETWLAASKGKDSRR